MFIITEKEKRIEEKIWVHGVLQGKCIGMLKLKTENFLTQMIIGVKTEEGIKKSSNLFVRKDQILFSKKDLPAEIKELESLRQKLNEYVFQMMQGKDVKV